MVKLLETFLFTFIKIKEWWDREQLLEDHVQPLILVANTGESSSEFDSDDD
jgi:hypothetical protein